MIVRLKSVIACVAGALAFATQAQEPLETIEVVGTTPLGARRAADEIAANVQTVDAEDLREQGALDLADFMRRNLESVFVNEAQTNPLQPDIQYRGFVGSPLLGLPQGLAVYQDGVRLNEPFGDTVNWALIPDSAIDTVYLMPGSNPLFGLNALGGAISIETKDGFSHPGSSAEVYGGSFARLGMEAETGGSVDEHFAYFLTGAYFEEDGWRDFSPSEATQFFGNASWQLEHATLGASLTHVNTDLIGNGAAPAELLEIDRSAIFTRPDQTENELTLLNITGTHAFAENLALAGNVYVRDSDISSYNGDDSDFEECAGTPGFVCAEEDGVEELVLDQAGNPVPASGEVEGATVNRTSTEQDGMGLGLQATWTGELGKHENLLVVGLAYDESEIAFAASTELGALDPTRLAIPSGFFVGESFTRMSAETANKGVYVANTFMLADQTSLTISARYNDTRVTLRDELGTALDGDHDFSRLNPAIGLTVGVANDVTFYAGYSESNRAPSPVELTCADEDDPCRLPNAFLADPPLEQVVAATVEAGVRGQFAGGRWHAGVFRTANEDDILFISAGVLTNEGFFDNVGETRRDGVELGLDGGAGEELRWFANYTYLEATFRENFAVLSPNNPASVGGEIFVESGDRLPLIPSRLLKVGIHASMGSRLTLGAEALAGGDFYPRGDEGNQVETVDGYTVLNVRGELALNDNVGVFLNIDNVLDAEYETFGLFGEADEVLGAEFEDSQFLSPAAPRAAWLGVRINF
ncbi:MAG TPA: TonB-dependent receptor [Gammaproteobacteria bacterium]